MSFSDTRTETQLLDLPNGRTLAFCEYGGENGYPIFYAHGSPGSRLEGQIYHDKAQEYSIRLIAADRPGFGRSSFQPGRRLLDYPKDIALLADHLGIKTFGSIGHSGGGAFSIVCRQALPDQAKFAISIGGYTNFGEMVDAAKFLKTKADRMSVTLSKSNPRLFKFFFAVLVWGIKYAPKYYCDGLAKASGDADKAIIDTLGFREFLIKDQKEALIQGGRGAAQDAAILYDDWGVRLQEIPGKTILFHGTKDRMVPIEYAQHLDANIPGSVLKVLEGQGHLFPWQEQDLIFETVIGLAKR